MKVEYNFTDLNSTHQKGISRRKASKGQGTEEAKGTRGKEQKGEWAEGQTLLDMQGCSARHPARCALVAHCLLLDCCWESFEALRLSWME